MSSSNQNLSAITAYPIANVATKKISIVVAEWNDFITNPLKDACIQALLDSGIVASNIEIINVPGSFELVYGAKLAAMKYTPHAVITIGCVIQGETPHFDFICQAVANGLAQLNIDFSMPFIFGVLTPLTNQQAQDRAGGKHGNKGIEAAITALKMIELN